MYIGWLRLRGNDKPYRVEFDDEDLTCSSGLLKFTRVRDNGKENSLLLVAGENLISLDYEVKVAHKEEE